MPNKYNTGGVVSGDGGMKWGGSKCDHEAASKGTTYNQPNTKEDAKPGGYGSTGSKSTSKPSGKM